MGKKTFFDMGANHHKYETKIDMLPLEMPPLLDFQKLQDYLWEEILRGQGLLKKKAV